MERMRSPTSPERLVTAALLVAILAATGACVDDDHAPLPTAPAVAAPVAASAPAGDRSAAIEDALTRLVPSLSDPVAAEPLQAALRTLRAQLEEGTLEAQRGATTAAQSAIAAYERHAGPDSGDAPDLDAIRLAIESG